MRERERSEGLTVCKRERESVERLEAGERERREREITERERERDEKREVPEVEFVEIFQLTDTVRERDERISIYCDVLDIERAKREREREKTIAIKIYREEIWESILKSCGKERETTTGERERAELM